MSMNIGSAYFPVLAHFRVDLKHVFFGAGTGYAIAVEKPKIFGSNFDQPAGAVGVYVTMLEVGFKAALSDKVSVFSSVKSYALISSSTTYVLAPAAGFQINLE